MANFISTASLGIRQEVEHIMANVFYSTFFNVFNVFLFFMERFLHLWLKSDSSPLPNSNNTSLVHLNVNFFPSHEAHRTALISVSLAKLSQTPAYTAKPRMRSLFTAQLSLMLTVPIHGRMARLIDPSAWLGTCWDVLYPSSIGLPFKYWLGVRGVVTFVDQNQRVNSPLYAYEPIYIQNL